MYSFRNSLSTANVEAWFALEIWIRKLRKDVKVDKELEGNEENTRCIIFNDEMFEDWHRKKRFKVGQRWKNR